MGLMRWMNIYESGNDVAATAAGGVGGPVTLKQFNPLEMSSTALVPPTSSLPPTSQPPFGADVIDGTCPGCHYLPPKRENWTI